MLAWLQSNLPTILIIAALVLFFGFLVYTLIRDKKKGKSSCCGGCAGCAMSCPNRAVQCHPQANTDTATSAGNPKGENPEKT